MRRLDNIENWPELAKQSNWCAATLAKNLGVSLRTLQRYFRKKMGKSPKKWLSEHRRLQAAKLLQSGSSIKETAEHLGYKSRQYFSREFKRQTGCSPGQLLISATLEVKNPECRI
jgi:AraC-like DNA-binding protein